MKELLLIMANIMTNESIADKLKDAVMQYCITHSEDAKKEVDFYVVLWMSKGITSEMDLEKTLDSFEQHEKTKNFF